MPQLLKNLCQIFCLNIIYHFLSLRFLVVDTGARIHGPILWNHCDRKYWNPFNEFKPQREVQIAGAAHQQILARSIGEL